jgi:tetratricopeptide (TPR) repeat protein
MSKFSSRQWIAIAGAILFFGLLFFINRKAPSSTPAVPESAHAGNKGVDFKEVINASEDSLPVGEKQVVTHLKAALAASSDSTHIYILAKLVKVFDSIGQPVISAYYTEKLADMEKSPALWTHAGQQFYDYSSLGKQDLKDVLLQQAQECFSNGLKIDSDYADARVGLGECLVEGSSPMQGIMTIESVLRKDSNNRNAQLALGKFSMRSGQFQKAIYRFNRVLTIDPSYKESYIYLAQSYEGAGNKKEAVVNLKKYRIFAPDSAIKAEVDNYIQRIETDTTK